MSFEAALVVTDMAFGEEAEQLSSLSIADVIALFSKSVETESFYQTAELIATHIRDARCLAECAALAHKREPGGAYYRARFWAKSYDLLSDAEGEVKAKMLSRLCRDIGTPLNRAKSYINQGEAIATAERIVSNKRLRIAPAAVLNQAVRQGVDAPKYLIRAALCLERNPDATQHQIHKSWCEIHGGVKANLDIIKPSDWWAFSHPKWRQEEDFPGSIPGEIYANALYYFAPQIGVAVDPMAGSGMVRRVYEDRARWQKDMDFELELHLYDLHPCRTFIEAHDVRCPLPVKADWVFLDPPYFGQSQHLYAGEMAAATNYGKYLSMVGEAIAAVASSLNTGGRLCLLLPKWSGLRPEDLNHDIPADASLLAQKAGLRWIDAAFVSRGRQQEAGSAVKNNMAKRGRRMRSDTCVLNVFEK